MNVKALRKQWITERDEVVKSYDIERFKSFYEKWRQRGFYSEPLPSDYIIAISMRKMVYQIKSSTAEEKVEAKAWLKARGHRVSMKNIYEYRGA